MPDFRKDINKTILNLVELQRQLDNSEPYEDQDNEEQMLQTVYLGSILSLTPSGKVYMPWAHSNVNGCPRCKDIGLMANANGKRKKHDALLKKGLRLVETIKKEGDTHEIWQKHHKQLSKIWKQANWWNPDITCPECAGLGSLEARLDEDWWNQLESELETIGAWHHGSEGDGCDIMVSRVARRDATEDEQLEKERDECEICDERSCIGCARCE